MSDIDYDSVLQGGPRDGALLRSEGDSVVEVEIDDLIHRYRITTRDRVHDGRRLTVYTYDGVIDPAGAQPGVETPESGAHDPVDEDRLSR
jgi:hypothetical protein